MSRNSTTEAVVLRTVRIGEIHRGVTLLTRDLGIVFAMAHGASTMKSRLRPATNLFARLTVRLYHDPARDRYRLSEVDMVDDFPGIRAEIGRFYVATLWAEVIMKARAGGGDAEYVLDLLAESLATLAAARPGSIRAISVQFLWRFLGCAGFQPGLDTCASCGRPFGDGRAWISIRDAAVVCDRCRSEDAMELSIGARRYLVATGAMRLQQAGRVGFDSFVDLTRALHLLTQSVLETRLNTLAIGSGIID